MITVSAKELRLNLSEYLQRAMHGEQIKVIYRSRPAVKLISASAPKAKPGKAPRGSAEALEQAMAATEPYMRKHKSRLDPNKSIKELYHEMLDEKYGFSKK